MKKQIISIAILIILTVGLIGCTENPGVQTEDANSNSNLPTGLPRNRTISWDWDAIASAIDQVMKEGKNK